MDVLPHTSTAHAVTSCTFSAAITLPCLQSLFVGMLLPLLGLCTVQCLSLYSSLILKMPSLNYLHHKIPPLKPFVELLNLSSQHSSQIQFYSFICYYVTYVYNFSEDDDIRFSSLLFQFWQHHLHYKIFPIHIEVLNHTIRNLHNLKKYTN